MDLPESLKEELELTDAVARVNELAERSSAQLLGVDRVLREIRRPSARWSVRALLDRLEAFPSTPHLRRAITDLAESISAESDDLGVVDQRPYNSIIKALLARLGKATARRIARPMLHHRLKGRRDLAHSVLRWAGVDDTILKDILSIYQRTGEERLLKVLVSAKGAGARNDLLDCLTLFEDRYWQMRVLQAVLQAGRAIPTDVARKYPTEFLQAVGRAKARPAVQLAKRIARDSDEPKVLAFYAWAMFHLGEHREVVRTQQLLSRAAASGPTGR